MHWLLTASSADALMEYYANKSDKIKISDIEMLTSFSDSVETRIHPSLFSILLKPR